MALPLDYDSGAPLTEDTKNVLDFLNSKQFRDLNTAEGFADAANVVYGGKRRRHRGGDNNNAANNAANNAVNKKNNNAANNAANKNAGNKNANNAVVEESVVNDAANKAVKKARVVLTAKNIDPAHVEKLASILVEFLQSCRGKDYSNTAKKAVHGKLTKHIHEHLEADEAKHTETMKAIRDYLDKESKAVKALVEAVSEGATPTENANLLAKNNAGNNAVNQAGGANIFQNLVDSLFGKKRGKRSARKKPAHRKPSRKPSKKPSRKPRKKPTKKGRK